MKNSLIIVLFFLAGVAIGIFRLFPEFIIESNLQVYVLYLLIFLVGIEIGRDITVVWKLIKVLNVRIVLVPLGIVFGSLIGGLIFSVFTDLFSVRESLSVSAGFGYYSLSSILISQIRGELIGVFALLSNIFREILTLLCVPIFAKLFGKLAPIASAGATSVDTTLPLITRFVGKKYAVVSIFSGTVLTLLVPFLVPLILNA